MPEMLSYLLDCVNFSDLDFFALGPWRYIYFELKYFHALLSYFKVD